MVGSEEGLEIGGFGGWSANLLTFFMPTEAGSRFGPGLLRYASGGQYEGYAYLGAGTLLLGAVVIVARIASLRSRDTVARDLAATAAPRRAAVACGDGRGPDRDARRAHAVCLRPRTGGDR